MGQLIDMIKRHEGVKSKVYKCTQGYETIGVGRNISESGLGLSDDEIDYLLHNDLERCNEELSQAYDWYSELSKPRRDAMVDICFNLVLRGCVGLSKLWKLCPDSNLTSPLMSSWIASGLHRSATVLKR